MCTQRHERPLAVVFPNRLVRPMNATHTERRWWLCCWGHIFEHDPVAAGEELSCPHTDSEGLCETHVLYAPFTTRADAEDASIMGRPDWAPWVR